MVAARRWARASIGASPKALREMRSAPGRLITSPAFNSAEPGLGIARGCITLPDLQHFVRRSSASGRFIDDHPGILAHRHNWSVSCRDQPNNLRGVFVAWLVA